jgi:hypothetical protein
MQLMIKYPTYATHPPLWDLTLIGALNEGVFLYSRSHIMYHKYQQHVIVGPLINMYINIHIFVLLLH